MQSVGSNPLTWVGALAFACLAMAALPRTDVRGGALRRVRVVTPVDVDRPDWFALPAIEPVEDPVEEERGTVVVHRPGAWQGANLVVSGRSPQAALVDMDGTVLQRWSARFGDVFPGWVGPDPGPDEPWHRTALVGSDLLVSFEGAGIARLGPDSRVVWSRPFEAIDLAVDRGGIRVWLAHRRPPHGRFNVRNSELVYEELWLDGKGGLRRRRPAGPRAADRGEQVLENGNVLASDGPGVFTERTGAGEVVWSYRHEFEPVWVERVGAPR